MLMQTMNTEMAIACSTRLIKECVLNANNLCCILTHNNGIHTKSWEHKSRAVYIIIIIMKSLIQNFPNNNLNSGGLNHLTDKTYFISRRYNLETF